MAESPVPAGRRTEHERLPLKLTLAVLVAHGLLLWSGPGLLSLGGSDATLDNAASPDLVTLNTRVVTPPPAAAPQDAAKGDQRRPAPRPSGRRAPSASTPEPSPTILPAEPPASDVAPSDPAVAAETSASPGAPEPSEPAPPPASRVDAPVATAPPPASQAVQVPPSARLKYKVHGEVRTLPYDVNGEITWTHDGSQYRAQASISAFLLGSRTQTSQGEIGAGGLMPRRFGDKVRAERAAHFDPEKGRVTFSANTPEVTLAPGMQDRLSLFIQLAALVGADPARFPAGARVSVPTVSATDADTWVFTVEGEESLELPAGPMTALKLLRVPRREYDTRVELWLAPRLHYLPARIRITQTSGDFADQQLSDILTP